MENSNFQFILKERPVWDVPKEVEIVDDKGGITYEYKYKTKPVQHTINIQQPFDPKTYSQILRNAAAKEPDESGILIISQYMTTDSEDDILLRDRIIKDGRLLFSCLDAMSVLLDFCETELKKN